jgi:nucleoside-diphosphate-sugar epimerase
MKLTAHGWEVLSFDRVPSPDKESGVAHEVNVELTDMGQVICALQEVDMVCMLSTLGSQLRRFNE